MAKTIKELAEESYSIHDDPWMHNAYIDGANDILKEIEQCFPHYPVDSWGDTIDAIQEKIKELKGE